MKEKKLTPAEEAIRHDREMDRRSGIEPGLNTREQREKIKEKKKEQELSDESIKNSHLEKFVKFNEDPLAYLYSLTSQGDFADRGKSELFTLMTLVKIEKSLAELTTLLKARK